MQSQILALAFAASLCLTPNAQSVGLPEAVSPETKRWAPVFDFDGDSCYPAPAVSPRGKVSRGLRTGGSITGECRQLDQLRAANTYCRSASVTSRGSTYRVSMYALYFEKDQVFAQAASNADPGHRHDWEHALVWTRDGVLTHASYSAHGSVTTRAKQELEFDASAPETVKVVYHKDGLSTHAFRFAKPNEPPENELDAWITPALVEWDLMRSASVSNDGFRQLFNTHDFGAAVCPFDDANFPREIAKGVPLVDGMPSPAEWKRAIARMTYPNARLLVSLYDNLADATPQHVVGLVLGEIADLNHDNFADKAARVVVERGPAYRDGDRLRLLDNCHAMEDPAEHRLGLGSYDLNPLGWADRAACLACINDVGDTRLVVQLFDRSDDPFPRHTVELSSGQTADLNDLDFADKAARVAITKGPAYRPGDRLRLFDRCDRTSEDGQIVLDPGDYDLNERGWADRAACMACDSR